MADDSLVQIILRAKDEFTATVNKTQSSLRGLSGTITTLNQGWQLMNQIISTSKRVYDLFIGKRHRRG